MSDNGRHYCTVCKTAVIGGVRAHEREQHGRRPVCRTIPLETSPSEDEEG